MKKHSLLARSHALSVLLPTPPPEENGYDFGVRRSWARKRMASCSSSSRSLPLWAAASRVKTTTRKGLAAVAVGALFARPTHTGRSSIHLQVEPSDVINARLRLRLTLVHNLFSWLVGRTVGRTADASLGAVRLRPPPRQTAH